MSDNCYIPEVKIGNQIWIAENLNVATFRNGDVIPEAKTEEEWKAYDDAGEAAWCYYDNDRKNGEKYGKLYNWYAVNDPRGLAPKGWHVPSDKEWNELVEYLGGEEEDTGKWINAGKRMKTSHGWEDNGNGTDEVGFSGLPGGSRTANGAFYFVGELGYWWSSTEGSASGAWNRYLGYGSGNVRRDNYRKNYGFSVRCLRD